jgi:hypothetical protein
MLTDRLKHRIQSDWGNSETSRPVKFYWLTTAGRKQRETERETWERLAASIALVSDRAAEVSS